MNGRIRASLVSFLAIAMPLSTAMAQGDVEMLGRLHGGAVPPPGFYQRLLLQPNAFEFAPDNGWTVKARQVRQTRLAAGLAGAPQFSHP
ncbi:MAG TPA: hypothetical protein VGI83_07055, partial [Gemmatimonadales bacterium]